MDYMQYIPRLFKGDAIRNLYKFLLGHITLNDIKTLIIPFRSIQIIFIRVFSGFGSVLALVYVIVGAVYSFTTICHILSYLDLR